MVRINAYLPAVFLYVAATVAAVADPVVGANFHELFEERCLSCHGHAGPFMRDHVTLDENTLTSSRGQSLDDFLDHHAGGLSAPEKALFLDVFRAQITSEGLFESKCRNCHDRAFEFARLRLAIRDDRLVGRYSGNDIAEFLTRHGRLSGSEAQQMTNALRALLQGRR
ncbi:hypothetical protein PEL8287_01275 [Roseovarius litorisediminis]|uniref:Cytochrome c domain-containing protein n=1 Tax=Roseovarius litorisediminis TaxID=1312363 RepID=A0A1Y5S2P8_9RHOB|nr:hypothetical protein [Roseovarius litorisediminis]SLN28299.1 hypothetical protein PEL8287_01275 [Roseovarius litorisediminis]